ncbi:hypothetical protein GLOIN_2v1830120 [Rhizophagus clarus]|uniref:Uncharacterized protein n=1 Tax=Rhizophagus clarus TaxID=94130 RepID=A0A8H3L1S3_9GLOM|nr:hypothetical protein GLOIN_2v1830120 [Rhizophagus clarus]
MSLTNVETEVATKLEEIQTLQSRVEELEQEVSLAQKKLSEMEFLKRKVELKNVELTNTNVDLDLEKTTVQKALIEKDSLLQEAILKGPVNTSLAEQIPKISNKSEVIEGNKGLKKGNKITNPKTTLESPYSLFFQNHSYEFPTRYAKEPRDGTTPYETLPHGYG